MKDRIGKWIGNFFLIASIFTIPSAYLYLYCYGHLQHSKLDLEYNVFFITSFCYALIFLTACVRLSDSKKLDNYVKKLGIKRIVMVVIGTISTIILLFAYLMAGFKAQEFIERSVESKIKTQLTVDGVRVTGIVEGFHSKYYGRTGDKIRHDQIEIRYVLDGKIKRSSYALDEYNSKKIKKGDSLNFIVSSSKPEYILLKN
jgi:amino acid transporter